MKLTMSTSAYSSVVGRGLVLTAPDGRAIGQIAILGSAEVTDYRAYSEAVAKALDGLNVMVADELVRPHPTKAA